MAEHKIELDLNRLAPLPRNKEVGIGCIGAGFIMSDRYFVADRQAGFRPVAISEITRPARQGRTYRT